MKHIVLLGDSIFDNAPYVSAGESVAEQLSAYETDSKVTLLAVDGDVTTDVATQLASFPNDATDVFVSCGGNDALRVIDVLTQAASSVGEALLILAEIRELFRQNYRFMLQAILAKSANVTVCTIYNHVPGLSDDALTALALFNEVILEEAAAQQLSIIDLRNVCDEPDDYSAISPIEPSAKGARKIVSLISLVSKNVAETDGYSILYGA